MKTMRYFIGIVFLVAVVAMGSCAEDMKTSKMRVELSTQGGESKQQFTTKDLSLVSAVNLDIRECHMHYSQPDNIEGWFALPCQVGIYNVLNINNDVTVVLVHDTLVPYGTVTQFRWILGPYNSVEIAGIVYPLKVPSAEESGLKINLKGDIYHDHWIEVRLIFDAAASILEKGNGEYMLTPVIKVDVINQD
jgi:hypothetical protein